MPHMREGPDTWRVSQTRRRVESSVLSPFKPREPAERRVDHPPPTRAISTRRTCKIDTSPSPEEPCWLLFSTCTILLIRHVVHGRSTSWPCVIAHVAHMHRENSPDFGLTWLTWFRFTEFCNNDLSFVVCRFELCRSPNSKKSRGNAVFSLLHDRSDLFFNVEEHQCDQRALAGPRRRAVTSRTARRHPWSALAP